MEAEFNVEEVHPEWLELSTELLNGYEADQPLAEYFKKWQKLVTLSQTIPKLDKGAKATNDRYRSRAPVYLTHSSPEENKTLLKISYENFLVQFPYCEQYWINFAQWMFKLGQTEKAIEIYENSLKVISKSLLIWVSYLKFCETVITSFDQLLLTYEKARVAIGLHYYAHTFYDMYITLLEKNKKTHLYYKLLRRIIEIPLYHYGKYFKEFLHLVENVDVTTAKYLVTKAELNKNMKMDWVDLLRSPEKLRELQLDLKKKYINAYITTQYHSYKAWDFEKNISRLYFTVDDLKRDELALWDSYLQYMENKNLLPAHKESEVITSKTNRALVEMTFERCIISTAQYPHFWIKYSNWFLNLDEIENAIEVLKRGIFVNAVTNTKLRLRLIDLYMLTNIDEAVDLAVELCTLLPNSVEPFLKLCQVVQLSATSGKGKGKVLIDLISNKLKDVQGTKYEYQFDFIFTDILTYSAISFKDLVSLFEAFADTKTSFHFWKSYYDFYYLPTADNLNQQDKIESIKKTALEKINDFEKAKLVKAFNYSGLDTDKNVFAEFTAMM